MRQELELLITKIEEESYHRGWADAIASLVEASQKCGTPQVPPIKKNAPPPKSDGGKRLGGQPGFRSGSTVFTAMELIRKRPGMTTSEIISHMTANDPSVVERTIRTALGRLKDRDHAVQDEGRWSALS